MASDTASDGKVSYLGGAAGPPLVAAVVMVGVWEAACHAFAIPTYIVPAPTRIWAAIAANPATTAPISTFRMIASLGDL